ncbi:hypothetical protein B0T24DRAFT_592051 [Lasiosphaeria ovina]|uniref:G domain-containing protein n=1 Tax=Lasiosphaeria ovina TaxID=92902 RepID=A0AAE0NA27_9PEZI|nr:hypothetical protein B0T24DRAFT_592051 [Lasiosphaeria ovina]
MASDQPIKHIYIAVVGVAGAGKTSLISTCTGIHEQTSHSVVDAFQDISFTYNDSTRVHLVEIPGFGDADTDALNELNVRLVDNFVSQGITFSGIIFLHPISDEQTTRLALRNLELLKELCGAEAEVSSSAVIATSMWSKVAPEEGERREKDLAETEGIFSHLHKEGSKVLRYQDTRESALDILSHVLSKGVPPPSPTLYTETDNDTMQPEEMQTDGPHTDTMQGDPMQTDAADTDADADADTDTVVTQIDTTEHDMTSPDDDAAEHGTIQTDTSSAQHNQPQPTTADKGSQTEQPTSDAKSQLDAEIAFARERNLARLADIYRHMEQALAEHDSHVEVVFRGEISALKSRIAEGVAAHEQLTHELHATTAKKDAELAALRNSLHDAHAAASAAAFAADAALAQQHAAAAQQKAEHEARVRSVLDDAEARVRAADAARATEVQQLQAEFERERLQNMRAVKAELARMADREQEARERARRAEMAAAQAQVQLQQANRRSESPAPRQPAALQSWAVARLWGVGQTRSR